MQRPAAQLGIVAVLLSGAGCADDAELDVRKPVAATVAKLQNALAAKDWRTICRHLTRPAHVQAGSVAHGLPTVYCAPDVRRAFGIVERGGGWRSARPAVTQIRGGWRADVPFVEYGGRWKLGGFFGATPASVEAIERTARRRPFPGERGRPIEAVDGRGRPCGDLDQSAYPEISGGCTFKVAARSAPIRMLTPFGDFKFSDCRISYRVSVDAAGRTWTDRWAAADIDRPGCSDVDPCKAGPFDLHPWKGRLTADPRGGYLHVMDMCMRTCIGSFTGQLVMRMTRQGGRWRARQTDDGASGFKIDGALAGAGDGFDLRD